MIGYWCGRRLGLMTLFILTLGFTHVEANDKVAASTLVNRAGVTLRNFAHDPELAWFRGHIKQAKGILIVPRLLKAGFIIGGSGGNGVLLFFEERSGTWTVPAFYTIQTSSMGWQEGAEAAELVLLVMSEKGRDALLSSKLQLGVDVSLAAGPVGAGAQASTADILYFARTNGTFAGMALDGSVVAVREVFNEGYYGRAVSPVDILVKHTLTNSQAASLRKALVSLK